MTSDAKIAEIYADIAVLVARDVRAASDGAFLMAEGGEGFMSVAIFQDGGDKIVYRDGSDELYDRLMEAWDATPEDQKWAAMNMTLKGDTFEIEFEYADTFDPMESVTVRWPRFLTPRFGDKPLDQSDP
jgi:hypothetical protein